MRGTPDQRAWLAHGEPVTLDNCEREPIHLPGRVQAHGALIVAAADGDHPVLQVSENLPALLGLQGGAEAVLGQPLVAILGAEATRHLLALPVKGPPSVRPSTFTLGPDVAAAGRRLVGQCFTPGEGLLAIDLEAAPDVAADGSAIAVQAALAAGRLSSATSMQEVADAAVELLWQATGFDRVWAYRFEPDGHGVVVAEQRSEGLDPFLGLHFPEADIPPQARDLYLRSGVRLIGDSATSDVPLLPELSPLTGDRLDLSGSDLRGVSPIHVRYLRNMGVRTSMSVPLVVDGRLWGLLSAHHYSGRHVLPMLLRSQCEVLGKLTSMQLAATAQVQRAQGDSVAQRHLHELVAHLGTASSVSDGLVAAPEALLGVCGAAGVVVRVGDTTHTVGRTPDAASVDVIVAALAACEEDFVATDHLAELDPALGPLARDVAGIIAIPISRRQAHWVIWSRPEQVEQVTWANRDQELVRKDPDGELDLGERESFERWAESVHGRSAPWSAAELAAARDVRTAIGEFALHHTEQLQGRALELARVNEELDAFAYSAAHDLRQPVRGIALRSQFLLEDAAARLTADERESLESITRMTTHMGSLVDSLLAYAKLDYAAHQPQRTALGDVLADVTELIGAAAERAEITVDDDVVDADPDGLRQVLFNLVWNGIKYSEGTPQIHVGTAPLSAVPGAAGRIRIPETSEREPTLIYVRDHGIGIDPAHHETIFGLFRRLHSGEEYGGGSGAGLALCRRIVQRSGGAIWAESAPGAGSTFYFTMGAGS